PLVDEQKGYLTAEFIVNGKHAKLEQKLNSGDEITVVPYISGG
ncbi:MAG: MoaD/ThiS family protein, partial [Firmicutes bacterium]|nr:MoaD/ThiS family protein [Bacillota bacterium]